jgi:hypothetical protein
MESESVASSEFIKEAAGPPGVFCVFEDDGETGHLYIYEPEGRGVVRHLHVYDRTPKLNIQQKDVQVAWTANLTKCGVRIWGKMRGIIDLASGREGRVWLESRDTPGIDDAEWLKCF